MKIFRFKKFDCNHSKSSMKIGVDAVLLGAWTDIADCRKALDVGTGCGVIALMLAQRIDDEIRQETVDREKNDEPARILSVKSDFSVTAIDIDSPSVKEANENFANSPWSDSLTALETDFRDLGDEKYDLIVSNPPYFDDGVADPQGARMLARHQGDLSPSQLLRVCKGNLSPTSRIALVLPYSQADTLESFANEIGYQLLRRTDVKGHANAPVKRSLMEFAVTKEAEHTEGNKISVADKPATRNTLILEETPGMPTTDHRFLCKNFYLKF